MRMALRRPHTPPCCPVPQAMAGEGAAPPDTTWWRKALTWLTSWTGSESPETVVEMDRQLTAQDAHGAVFSSLLSPSRGASGAGALSGGGGGDAGPMGEGKEGRTASPGSLSLDIPDDCGLTDDDDDDEPGEGGVVCAKRLADTAAPKWWTTVGGRWGVGRLRQPADKLLGAAC